MLHAVVIAGELFIGTRTLPAAPDETGGVRAIDVVGSHHGGVSRGAGAYVVAARLVGDGGRRHRGLRIRIDVGAGRLDVLDVDPLPELGIGDAGEGDAGGLQRLDVLLELVAGLLGMVQCR